MSVNKKSAARKAAAKYSTDLNGAVLEYCTLVGQVTVSFSRDDFNKAKEELLDLLPLYRHPANDEFAEYMQFIDYDCLEGHFTANHKPPFLDLLEKVEIEPKLLEEVKKYVEEAEQSKHALNTCQSKFTKLEKLVTAARQEYDKRIKKRPDHRNAKTVQALGFSEGTRKKDFDHKQLYIDYASFIRKRGLPRWVAIEKLEKKYNRSQDTVLHILKEQRAILLKKWKKESPSLASLVRDRLKGFIPQDR